jgi:cold shock CspA family protein
MRIHGTVVRWNDDRGFGFVALPQSREEVFVHISAFPRDGVRPRVGETISFELGKGPDGRKRAQAVWRPGTKTVARGTRAAVPANNAWARAALYLVVLLAAGAGAYFVSASRPGPAPQPAAMPAPVAAQRPEFAPQAQPSAQFSCDGRTHCSQMTSCAEATYFLRNCPNTEMDGNHDGEPCEKQWCN